MHHLLASSQEVILLGLLRQHRTADIEGWALIADEDLIWLVNPYGIDVGYYSHDAGGSKKVLERIANDDHTSEWGML